MGDFGEQTAVEARGDGRYTAQLSRDWEIWGPMGGYVAAIALRAAGAEAGLPRPASFFCHYLGVAKFEAVDIEVTALRRGRSAETLRVSITQGGKAIMDATVCVVADVDGLEHEITQPPDVPPPSELKNIEQIIEELELEGAGPPFPFWENFEARPLEFRADWPPPEPLPPIWHDWLRFIPTSTFADPWTDAARCLLLIDLPSWPAGSKPHAYKWPEGQQWVAPSLDLYASFHQFAPDDPWILIDGAAPIATEGLIGWNGRLWSSDFKLIASGGGQALCRRVPTPS